MSVTDAVQPATDDADQTIYIAVGVVVAGILLGLITVIVLLTVIRKKNGKTVRGSKSCENTSVMFDILLYILCITAGSPERNTELSAVKYV